MSLPRILGAVALAAILATATPHEAVAQQPANSSSSLAPAEPTPPLSPLPDAPDPSVPTGAISGTVTDPTGAQVPGARVTLKSSSSTVVRTLTTDSSGFFTFKSIGAGTFQITVTSTGFTPWVSTGISLAQGQIFYVPQIVLKIAAANTDVNVVLTQQEIAEEQVHALEHQRMFGVLPNFYTSYVWNAAPLTPKQKFKLAWRSAIDPGSFLGAAFGAGLEQAQNDYPGYGEGAAGYFTRFAASYGDGFNSSMISGALFPIMFHQDPRYFYKGTGTIRSRIRYALSTAIICRGDNGRPQPNYSNILGNLASGAISNSYYPAGSRGVRLTFVNTAIDTAANGVGAIIQEFLIKKISTGVPPNPTPPKAPSP
jgi:hypothetical protein